MTASVLVKYKMITMHIVLVGGLWRGGMPGHGLHHPGEGAEAPARGPEHVAPASRTAPENGYRALMMVYIE